MEYKTVPTTCIYCGCGCGILLEVLDGEVIGALPQKTHPISGGALCIKGWTSWEFVSRPDRIRSPMIRKQGELVEVSWDEALDYVAGEFKRIADENGPDATACLASAKCTNEENYLIQKLFRAGIGTNNIDHCARL